MVDRHSNSSSSNTYYSSNHPSFSSTLLDAIYRSIDSGHEVEDQRACMIDAWMTQKKKAREEEDKWIRGNISDLKVKTSSNTNYSSYSSSRSSSDVFSSREGAESNPAQRPKPVRIGHCSGFQQADNFAKTRVFGERGSEPKQKPKQESGFLKTKSRALKMYGDLKKAKQPISPGKKLAGFLNSLFSNNGSDLKRSSKVASRSNDEYSPSMKSTVTTTTTSSSACSSASSFSRSCLSKTPSSSRKSSTKRSVRFSSVSMIIDEEDSPHHQSLEQKSMNQRSRNIKAANSINEEIMVRAMEKNRRVDEVARDLLRNYHNKSHADDHDSDDDDCASYASSDLFELDNLSSIGLMEKVYADDDELPVYETTHLQNNNRSFANGTTMVI